MRRVRGNRQQNDRLRKSCDRRHPIDIYLSNRGSLAPCLVFVAWTAVTVYMTPLSCGGELLQLRMTKEDAPGCPSVVWTVSVKIVPEPLAS